MQFLLALLHFSRCVIKMKSLLLFHIAQMHSRTTMEMSICQAENGFPAFSFGLKICCNFLFHAKKMSIGAVLMYNKKSCSNGKKCHLPPLLWQLPGNSLIVAPRVPIKFCQEKVLKKIIFYDFCRWQKNANSKNTYCPKLLI